MEIAAGARSRSRAAAAALLGRAAPTCGSAASNAEQSVAAPRLASLEAGGALVQGRGRLDRLRLALSHGAHAVALAGFRCSAGMAPFLLVRAGPAGGPQRLSPRRASLVPGHVGLSAFSSPSPSSEWLELSPATAMIGWSWPCWRRGLRSAALAALGARGHVTAGGRHRWALGEALGRAGADADAVAMLRPALGAGASDLELERSLDALAPRGDPEAPGSLARGRSRSGGAGRLDRAGRSSCGRRLAPSSTGSPPISPVRCATVAPRRYLAERRLWDQALEQWRALVAAEPRDADHVRSRPHPGGDRRRRRGARGLRPR